MLKKHTLLLPLLCTLQMAIAVTATAQNTTLLSVADIVGNYGLDSAWVNDTAAMMRYLDEQPQDYVALTNLCVSIRTKAQKVIASIENDYTFRDSLIWIDESTALTDYAIYEYRLRLLADMMGRRSVLYSRLEQKRIEDEREAARRRAIEEAERQQRERNAMASDLRSNIALHHRAIITACDGAGITDKTKLKQLKDLYYSYLMVYNKYDLSENDATDESLAFLDQLNAFQNDLLENVLGENSLPHQIENFKNILKVRCEKENGDVYRSYSKVFRNTTVPVSFADVREYEDYTMRLRTTVNVQQRYLQTLDLRATIAAGTDAIINLYGKRYRAELEAYKDVLRGVDQLPAFTTNAESILFIQRLDNFVEAQQLYLSLYPSMEDNAARSDTLLQQREYPDVAAAYRDVQSQLRPMPSFRDADGAALYGEQLDEVARVQQLYFEVIVRRRMIDCNDDSLVAARKVDRILAGGYKVLRKQMDLKPNFPTVERGYAFLDKLQGYIEMQQLGLDALHKLQTIKENDKRLRDKELPYSNIRKAYARMYSAYQGVDEITNTEDLRRYDRQCDYVLAMQQAFFELYQSPTVADSDAKLKKETSVEKIKLVVGVN